MRNKAKTPVPIVAAPSTIKILKSLAAIILPAAELPLPSRKTSSTVKAYTASRDE
jgi:hypothetical protein